MVTDIVTLLHTLFLLVYAHAPWLLWSAAIVIGTFLWLYLCALANAAWRLSTSQDERDWFRFLRQARREHRRQALEQARQRGELHPLWTRGDGGYILGLLALAGVVILLCR